MSYKQLAVRLWSSILYRCSYCCMTDIKPKTCRLCYSFTDPINVRIFFCGTKSKLGRKSPHFWGFEITQLDTHSVVFLWMSDQPVLEVATYTTNKKHKRRKSMPSAGFETSIAAIKRLQAYAFDRMGNGIDADVLILTDCVMDDNQQRLRRIQGIFTAVIVVLAGTSPEICSGVSRNNNNNNYYYCYYCYGPE